MPRMTSPAGDVLTVDTREGVAALRALGWTQETDRPAKSAPDDEPAPRKRPGRPRKSED